MAYPYIVPTRWVMTLFGNYHACNTVVTPTLFADLLETMEKGDHIERNDDVANSLWGLMIAYLWKIVKGCKMSWSQIIPFGKAWIFSCFLRQLTLYATTTKWKWYVFFCKGFDNMDKDHMKWQWWNHIHIYGWHLVKMNNADLITTKTITTKHHYK